VETRGSAAIGAVAALSDPQRRRLYAAVRAARRPVTREEAAALVDISRKLAAFHLDKLVASGLLEVAVPNPTSPRRVGRAPKRYQPVETTLTVSVPARSYEELATVLVLAATTQTPTETAEAARHRVGRDRGRELGGSIQRGDFRGRLGPERALAFVERILTDEGFEPYRAQPGALRLANCPFHPVVGCAPELVCGINVDYLGGLLEGLGIDSLSVTFAPLPGECCVEVRAPGWQEPEPPDGPSTAAT
jgi:predicted ArsR family transcriptional regulator